MFGLGEVLYLQTRLVTFRADRGGLRRRQGLKADDLAYIAAAFDMGLRRSVTRLAPMLVALQ
jgi:hypothetical protein